MKIIRHIFLLAIGACCASCQDDSTLDTPSGEVKPLKISVGTEALTRTPLIGKWFGNGSQINVILLDLGATNSYNKMVSYQVDRPDIANEGTWVPAGFNSALEVKSDIARVLAHYPASGQLTLSADKQTITPNLPHTLDLGENNVSSLYESFHMALDPAKPAEVIEIFSAKADLDYMTGVGTNVSIKAGQSQVTSIAMRHAKAMVVVHLYKEDGYVGDDQLKSLTISNASTGTKPLKEGAFKIVDNSFTATNPITYRRTMSKFMGGTSFSTLVFPATIAANEVVMEFHVAAIRYTLKVPAKKWEAGKVYIYNVELAANGVEIVGGVMVYDWPEKIKLGIELE